METTIMGYIWRIVNKASPQEVGAHQEDAEYATEGFRGQQDSRGQAYSYFFLEEAAGKAGHGGCREHQTASRVCRNAKAGIAGTCQMLTFRRNLETPNCQLCSLRSSCCS